MSSNYNEDGSMNWQAAWDHLAAILNEYGKLVADPQGNPFFGLMYLGGLKARYLSGERTDALYNEMLECE